MADNQKEYTVKEISELLNVSKQTVRNYAQEDKKKNLPPVPCRKHIHTFYYTEDGLEEIALRMGIDYNKADNQSEPLPKPQTKMPKSQSKTEKIDQTDNQVDNQTAKNDNQIDKTPAMAEDYIEFLKNQIKTKDQQIADLTKQLENALTLTNQQQQLSVADKIVADTNVTDDEPEIQKKSFWKKIFKK